MFEEQYEIRLLFPSCPIKDTVAAYLTFRILLYVTSLEFYRITIELKPQMMASLNGQERTITEMRSLLEETGWKLVAIHLGSSSAFSVDKVIAVLA